MTAIDNIYRAVLFIEANLRESVSLADIASAAGYSLYHFCRLFTSLTGCGPYDYLSGRRLSEAAGQLADSSKTITSIAMEYRFNNPETFSRAFRRLFGLLPTKVRTKVMAESLALWRPLSISHLEYLHSGSLVLRPVAHLYETHYFDIEPLSRGRAENLFCQGEKVIMFRPCQKDDGVWFSGCATSHGGDSGIIGMIRGGMFLVFRNTGGFEDLWKAHDLLNIGWLFAERCHNLPYSLVTPSGTIAIPSCGESSGDKRHMEESNYIA